MSDNYNSINNNEEEEEEENSKNNLNDSYVYEICQLFDKENDEKINSDDLIDLIKALGIMLNEENIEIIQNFVDSNKKEKIPFE